MNINIGAIWFCNKKTSGQNTTWRVVAKGLNKKEKKSKGSHC
jgi:hypothetical protein